MRAGSVHLKRSLGRFSSCQISSSSCPGPVSSRGYVYELADRCQSLWESSCSSAGTTRLGLIRMPCLPTLSQSVESWYGYSSSNSCCSRLHLLSCASLGWTRRRLQVTLRTCSFLFVLPFAGELSSRSLGFELTVQCLGRRSRHARFLEVHVAVHPIHVYRRR
jgi:hypothetical protein